MKHYYDIESDENAYLDLKKEDLDGYRNPFDKLTDFQEENLHLYILSLFKNPEFFHTTCKTLFNIDLLPLQVCILRNLWTHSFPIYIASRGFGKSYLLAVYCLLRCLLVPGTKVVVVGSAFRQSKIIFEYMETIWRDAPILRSLCSNKSGPRRDIDRCTFTVNDSWVIAVPLGTGEKIRGLRAHITVADEFNSIDTKIYEEVIAGFSSVSANPVSNVKKAAQRKSMVAKGLNTEILDEDIQSGVKNQAILSGTCGYDFEPFANYWKKYKNVINTRGDLSKLLTDRSQKVDTDSDDDDDDDIPEYMKKIDWRQFCIIRIPYEIVPEGFMSDATVSRSRATMHSGTYAKEYATCFSSDSEGFFKSKAINAATATDKNCGKPNWPTWCPEPFDPVINGLPNAHYVMGIDPASEQDNFALVILECHAEHQRVIYSWTTNKKDFQARQRIGLVETTDYYSFCCRKIRDLMKSFPISDIGIDSQGGGYTIAEGLKDQDKLRPGEIPIYPIIQENKKKDTDDMPGLHILHLINFRDSTWTSQANHGLRKDIEDKVILFPRFDSATLGIMGEKDKIMLDKMKEKGIDTTDYKVYDTFEDCAIEIQELKEELTNIIVERNPSGGERFDTPSIKTDTGKKGRMRKDRYSALVICNMIARMKKFEPLVASYQVIGASVNSEISGKPDENAPMYVGSEFANQLSASIFGAVKR